LEGTGMDGIIIFTMNIQEMGWDVDCIDLAQDRGRRTALLNVLTKCGKFLD
jgi:hypothetical protein